MEQQHPKHLSPWIAWSLVIGAFGVALFCTWYYYFQVGVAYDNAFLNTVGIKKNTNTTTTTSDATKDWKTYTNSKYGFSFKYPNNSSESSDAKTNGLSFNVVVNNINTMEDAPLKYDKANAQKDKIALGKGDVSTAFGEAVPSSYKLLTISGALAKELTILQQLEVCNVQFNRQAIIYKGDNQIILSWRYLGNDIINNNPAYFTTDSKNCGSEKIWKNANDFYANLVTGKTDTVSQTWYKDFDKIISTFQFTK